MSWLSDIGEFFGSGNTVPTQGGANFYASLLPSIISAGAGLAGTYFSLDQQKQSDEMNIAQRQAELEAAKEAAAKAGGGGGGAGNAAKLGALTSLYNNWASNTERSGEALSASAQATGRLYQDPIMARLAALR
jgi:hypothetical protein